MKKQNHVNFITVLLFFGIIGTFTVYFGMTALLQGSGDIFTFEHELDRAVYENERLDKIITELNFKIFRRVENDNVIVGSDGFLFEHTDKNGYRYLLDYQGELAFSDEELQNIKSSIDERCAVYENAGCEYLLVVIPNSQTVYSEKMPFYYGKMSENTRLSMLEDYLNEQGTDFFLDATNALIAAKKDGLQYNNTENSLNAYGAYTVYSAVLDKLNESLPEGYARYELGPADFQSRFDVGRAIARQAALQDLVPNRTISLSVKPPENYEIKNEYEGFKTTDLEAENSISVMIEYTDEWNRIIMQPYFSNTFDKVSYKSNHSFSEFANSLAKPDVVIQIIGENELYLLTDKKTQMTYSAVDNKETNGLRTAEPTVLGSCYLDADTICIYGIAEPGADVSVKCDISPDVTQRAPDGRFFISVDIPASYSEISFEISAKLGEKKASASVDFEWKADGKAISRGVAIGSNSYLFGTRYKVDEEGFAVDAEKHRPNMSVVKDITEKNTEYVYAIVPSKLTVYKNHAPSELLATAARLYSLREGLQALLGEESRVIDLTQSMLDAEPEDLYYLTGNKLTDNGAFEIYRGIMLALGKEPSVTKDMLDGSELLLPGGEQIAGLGLNTTVVHERSIGYTVRGSELLYVSLDDGKYCVKNSDEDMPTAIILCDSQGEGIVKYLAEDFSELIVYETGNFRLDPADLDAIKPDYIIRITGEENIVG